MHTKIPLIITTLVLLLAFTASTQPIQAQGPGYYIYYSYPGNATCSSSGFSLPYKVTWDTPPGNVTQVFTERLNGSQYWTETHTGRYIPNVGSATRVQVWGLMGLNPPLPYSNVTTIVSSIAGGPVITTTTITIVCTSSGAKVTIINCPWDCGSSGSTVTFFDPKDGRKNGWPGDRVVVWCNLDSGILDVYGINGEGKGFPLTTFNVKDVVRAGIKGITKNLGSTGLVSVSVDDQNNFWLAWNGGPFNANGQGDWAKGFNCPFKR